MAVDIYFRVLGGELAGAGEIEEKRVVVADFVVTPSPVMPWLSRETTNAVSVKYLEEDDCPSFIISPLVKNLFPTMFRASIFEDSLIDLLLFQVNKHLCNLFGIGALWTFKSFISTSNLAAFNNLERLFNFFFTNNALHYDVFLQYSIGHVFIEYFKKVFNTLDDFRFSE